MIIIIIIIRDFQAFFYHRDSSLPFTWSWSFPAPSASLCGSRPAEQVITEGGAISLPPDSVNGPFLGCCRHSHVECLALLWRARRSCVSWKVRVSIMLLCDCCNLLKPELSTSVVLAADESDMAL